MMNGAVQNKLQLPLPPSANRYYRLARGRLIVSPEARAYRALAGCIAHAAQIEPLNCDVKLSADFYIENRRRDLDNSLKVLLDSLNGVAWIDDRQIVELHARCFLAPQPTRGRREGCVILTIEPLTKENE